MNARRAILCLSIIAYSLLLSACAFTYYRDADGGRLLRITLGTDQQVGPVNLKSRTTHATLGGATTSQGDTAAKVVSAAAEAIKPTILP